VTAPASWPPPELDPELEAKPVVVLAPPELELAELRPPEDALPELEPDAAPEPGGTLLPSPPPQATARGATIRKPTTKLVRITLPSF
jgi:hypothetical protein